MKIKNKFIIGVAALLSMGVLLASPVKAGIDEDEAARLGISVGDYYQLRHEANMYGFNNPEELIAARKAGFEPLMYSPIFVQAAVEFRDAQKLAIDTHLAYQKFKSGQITLEEAISM